MKTPKKAESTAKPKDKATKARKPAAPPPEPPDSSHPDWKAIELDYRAGIKTLRQIADEHGISEGSIRKRAKREGWTRDLSARIQSKAEELVRKQAVRSEVRKEAAASEREVVEANAQAVADIRLAHRKDIQKARRIAMNLLEELEQQTGKENVELLEMLGDLMYRPDDKGQDKLNELYHKIISLPGRAKTMKDLGESVRVLVGLERQAFGMDEKGNDTIDPLQKLLDSIASRNNSAFTPVAHDPEHETDDA